MRIAIGSDHAGFLLKQTLEQWLLDNGYEVTDLGTHSEDRVDYPHYGALVGQAVARGEGPQSLLVTLGYAGWSAGQLERELAANAWLTVAADPEVVFGTPVERRLPAAMRLLGIDPMQLSEDAGHA